MSRCVFCHEREGHTDPCPMNIATDWTMVAIQANATPGHRVPPRDGPWLDLARTLLEAWRTDSSVHDRGTSQDEARVEALWGELERALDEGDATKAMAHLFVFYNPEPSTRASRHSMRMHSMDAYVHDQ